jgi:phage gp29-like protein
MPTKQANSKNDQKLKPDYTSASIKIENPRNLSTLYMSEFSGITPDKIKYYLETRRKGLNFWTGLFFDEIRRRDLHIGALCQTRKLAAANKEWNLAYKPDSSIPEPQQIETIKFIKECLEQINIVKFIANTIEAQIQGIAPFEIDYRASGSRIYLDRVRYIPNHLMLYDDQASEYKYLDYSKADAARLRTLGWNAMLDRIDISGLTVDNIAPVKLLNVFSLDGNAPNAFMNGVWDSLIWGFLFKNYGLKDWGIYVERFANPAVIGKRPALMNKEALSTLMNAVKYFGHLERAVITNDSSIDIVSDPGKSSANQVFDRYTWYWDKAMAIRVLGQSLTTDIGNAGSKAAVLGHDIVRWDYAVADMLLAKHTVNTLIRRLIDLNEPNVTEYPLWSFDEEQDIDYKLKRSEVFRNLRIAGWLVSQADVEEEFDIDVEPIADTSLNLNEGGGEGSQQYIGRFIDDFWNSINS